MYVRERDLFWEWH